MEAALGSAWCGRLATMRCTSAALCFTAAYCAVSASARPSA
jgi:hypothetical protein